MSKQKSFAWVWILIIILILALGGGIFYYFILKKSSSTPTTNESQPEISSNQFNWSTMGEGPYKDKISFATSADLTNWTDSGQILAEHASVPDAIIKDNVIFVYFVDVSKDGVKEQIGLIKSTDLGKTWSSKQIVTIKGLGDKAAVDPDPFLLEDGRIRLFYLDLNAMRSNKNSSAGDNTIYSAISTDGVSFTEEGACFTYKDIFDPNVVKVNNTWRLYVGTGDQKILSATSTDGLKFTYEGVALVNAAVPDVYFDGTKYWLFTAGIDIATSVDGKTFTKTQQRFDSGKLTADPGVVKLAENSYFMVYKTRDEMPGNNNPPPKN